MAVPSAIVVEFMQTGDYQRLVEPGRHSLGMKAGRVHLAPGQACGQHSTEDREEVLVFLSGQGTLQIGQDLSLQVGQGKVAYIPPKTLHNVVNTGTAPLAYVFCVAPALTL
ncbi:MAG: cupin domain-containing protein [Phycisphaerae bacterium]|nr:cupin domain-containing protein [Phycisphaerae bacterium]